MFDSFFFLNPKLFKENCELDLKRREVDDIYCLNMGAPWRAQIQSEEEEEEAQAHFIDVCKCVGVAANWMRQQEKKKGVARFEYKIRRKAHLQFKWAKRGVISPIFPSSSPTFPHSSSNVYKSYRYIRRGYITVDRRRQQDELTLPFSLNLLFLLSWTTRPSFFYLKKAFQGKMRGSINHVEKFVFFCSIRRLQSCIVSSLIQQTLNTSMK